MAQCHDYSTINYLKKKKKEGDICQNLSKSLGRERKKDFYYSIEVT